MVVIYRYGCISKAMYVLIRGGRVGASERKVIQTNGTLRGTGGVKLYFKRN